MKILSIETSGRWSGYSIVEEEKVKIEVIFSSDNLSRVFLPSLKSAFRETSTNIRDIDLVAISVGPGSFTGLRIGMSIGKSLSLSHHIPLVGIPTPYIIRENVTFPSFPLLILIKARRKEVYTFLYEKKGDMWEEIIKGEVIEIKNLKEIVKEKVIAIGEGALLYKEEIEKNLGKKVEFLPFSQSIPHPLNLAFLAGKMAGKTNWEEGLSLSPIYISPPRIG